MNEIEKAKDYFLKGMIKLQGEALEEAEELFLSSLKILPNRLSTMTNLAAVQLQLGKLNEAELIINESLNIFPEDEITYLNKAKLLEKRSQWADALKYCEKAIDLKKDYAETYYLCGNILGKLGRLENAIENFNKAISFREDYASAYIQRGTMQHLLKLFQEAIESFKVAIKIDRNSALAFNKLGITLQENNQEQEALESYNSAIFLDPKYAEAHHNIGSILLNQKEFEQSIFSYKRALEINPCLDYTLGNYLHAKMFICDWFSIEKDTDNLIEFILNNKAVYEPFMILNLTDLVSIQKHAAQNFSANKFPVNKLLGEVTKFKSGKKIKLAFLSADFREHPMGYNFVGFFENIDRDKFEIFGVSFLKVSNTSLSRRLVKAFDVFKVVDKLSDAEVCAWIREQQIDITIDMMGHTVHNRQGIFAMKCSPVQVNQFSWTSGATYMDYIIADPISIPSQFTHGYSEKVAYVPDTLFATDDKRKIAERTPLRREVNLPQEGLVFCCFNSSHKITPAVFDIWVRILKKVPNSVLWIRSTGISMERNLCKEALKRGADPQRLVFAGQVPTMEEHLARYRLADLFLDTYPFCAQTTASDSLWAGVPVVTCMGESSMSRICASMLFALKMQELVANSLEEYEIKILEIANDSIKLNELKQKLLNSRKNTALFNTTLYTQNVEKAYLSMLN